jgi:hypothetical protein
VTGSEVTGRASQENITGPPLPASSSVSRCCHVGTGFSQYDVLLCHSPKATGSGDQKTSQLTAPPLVGILSHRGKADGQAVSGRIPLGDIVPQDLDVQTIKMPWREGQVTPT